MLHGRLRLDAAARQLGGGDDRQRRGRRGDEHRREEVCVRERRDRPDAHAGRPAQRDQIEALEGERHRRRLGEEDEPPEDAAEPQPPERPAERRKRHAERDRGVRREPPRERDEPVLVRERDEHHEPGDASGREADRRRPEPVLRRERCRGQRGEHLDERRCHEPGQRGRREVGRLLRQLAGEELGERLSEEPHHERRRQADDEDGGGVRAGRGAARADQLGHRRQPQRLRRERQRDVHAVRREQPVGARVAPEFLREDRRRDRAGRAEDEAREPCKDSASQGAASFGSGSLAAAAGPHPSDHGEQKRLGLDRGVARAAARGLRLLLRGPHRPRDGRGRLHGLAPDRGALPPRRARPRVRPGHLERRPEQHRADPRSTQGALGRPDRQALDRPARPTAEDRAGPALRLPPRRAGARRRVVAPPVRDRDGEHDRDAQSAPVRRRPRPRAREVRHGGHVGGVRQRARVGLAPPRLRRCGLADPP